MWIGYTLSQRKPWSFLAEHVVANMFMPQDSASRHLLCEKSGLVIAEYTPGEADGPICSLFPGVNPIPYKVFACGFEISITSNPIGRVFRYLGSIALLATTSHHIR